MKIADKKKQSMEAIMFDETDQDKITPADPVGYCSYEVLLLPSLAPLAFESAKRRSNV